MLKRDHEIRSRHAWLHAVLLAAFIVLPSAAHAAPPPTPRPILGTPLRLTYNDDLWSARITQTESDQTVGLNWEKDASGLLLAWGLAFATLREETPEALRLAAKGESSFGVDHWIQSSFGIGFYFARFGIGFVDTGLYTRGTFDLSLRSGGESDPSQPLRVAAEMGLATRFWLPWEFIGSLSLGAERDFTGEIMDVEAPTLALRSSFLLFRRLGSTTPGDLGRAVVGQTLRFIAGETRQVEDDYEPEADEPEVYEEDFMSPEEVEWASFSYTPDPRPTFALGVSLDRRPGDKNGELLYGLTVGFIY